MWSSTSPEILGDLSFTFNQREKGPSIPSIKNDNASHRKASTTLPESTAKSAKNPVVNPMTVRK